MHQQNAIIRQLGIVGEATKRLSPGLRDANPEIPWKRIAGLCHVLIYNYFGVDLDSVWAPTDTEIRDLKQAVEALLEWAD